MSIRFLCRRTAFESSRAKNAEKYWEICNFSNIGAKKRGVLCKKTIFVKFSTVTVRCVDIHIKTRCFTCNSPSRTDYQKSDADSRREPNSYGFMRQIFASAADKMLAIADLARRDLAKDAKIARRRAYAFDSLRLYLKVFAPYGIKRYPLPFYCRFFSKRG